MSSSSRTAFREAPLNLDGESLRFAFDLDQSRGVADMEFIVSERELWRERAIWEDIDTFNRAKADLRGAYGTRFAGLHVSDAAEAVLLGDRIAAAPLEPL